MSDMLIIDDAVASDEPPLAPCNINNCDVMVNSKTQFHVRRAMSDPTHPNGWSWKMLYYCDEHLLQCEDCEEKFHHGQDWASDVDKRYCEDCADNYRSCERCGDATHIDHISFVGQSDSCYCESCIDHVANWCDRCDMYEWEDEYCENNSGLIESYGYKPEPRFFATQPNERLFMGFELEVEARQGDLNTGAETIISIINSQTEHIYLKEDSSINFGFEIVTHPMTLDYFSTKFPWSGIEALRQQGFRSWDTSTCGFHVHMSRSAFRNRAHLLAFTYLINRNGALSRTIAGRNSDYGDISDNSRRDNNQIIKHRRGYGGNRYNAVNLCNTDTVEIRMFKGSLKVERIKSYLEFCHAAFEYSKGIRSGADAQTMLRPEEFASWIRQAKKYPNLVSYLPEFTPIVTDNE